MKTVERRERIIGILCEKRRETVKRLSYEFNVSERTVRRDIEALSKMYPIYTKSGKYGGGVYILENFRQSTGYMSDKELSLLIRICEKCDWLTAEDIKVMKNIIKRYSQTK